MSPRKTRIVDRVLHWLSAGAIIFLLFDIGFKVHIVDYRIKGAVQHKQDAIEIHALVACILLLILVSRLIWYRFFLAKEFHLKYTDSKHKLAVRIVHFSMYLTFLLLMMSGVLMVLNYEHPLNILGIVQLSEAGGDRSLFFSAHDWHLYFESTVYFLIFLHLAGVMYSHR